MVDDISRVQVEMNQPFETLEIRSLCSTEANQVVFNCFKVAKPLSSIATSFLTCTKVFPSALFQHYWSQQMKKMKTVQLAISDVASKLWKPVFDACCVFLEEVRSMEIVLSEVDRLLDLYKPEELHFQLCQLDNAICECLSQPVTSNQVWIRASIQRMEQYRSLRQHADAAKTFLQLRDTLRLSGNFGIIDKLSTEVKVMYSIFV